MSSCAPPKKEIANENNPSFNQPGGKAGLPTGQAGMVWIPGGEFMMGDNEEQPANNAQQLHAVKVDGFWMDETEVTNAQFKLFVKETSYKTVAERPLDWEELKKQVPPGTPKPGDDVLQPGSMVFTPPSTPVTLNDYSQWWKWVVGADWLHPTGPGSSIDGKETHPVVHIAFEDAISYATWAGKRLPTEAEYEFAARGGLTGKAFSWGDELNPQGKYLANYFQGAFPTNDTAEDGFKGTSPVKSFQPNGYGVYDIIGNVWELCSDWYSVELPSNNSQLLTNPAGPRATLDPDDPYAIKHVSKGGSFVCSAQYCSNYKPSGRQGSAYDSGMSHTGFRCVKDSK
ncbi:MAG: formylglycine-generating enzyme family protein [Bacteroidia bacterium]|nr:formylglycine-generating enzyme family protein [Bacteroidia bacterium]